MTPRWIQHTVAGAALTAVIVGALYAAHPAYHPEPHPRIAVLSGPFELEDKRGRRFIHTDLIGKPTLLAFGVTRCPDVSKSMLPGVTPWVRLMGSDGDKLRVVFVTLDPEFDTPAVLRHFLRSTGIHVTCLTGTVQDIDRMTQAYGVTVPTELLSGSAPWLTHPAAIYLLDSDGRFIAPISYAEAPTSAVAKLERLVRSDS